MAKLIIHRGTHQIGGSCTEISVNGQRILIDFGANLPGSDETAPIKDGELAAIVFDGCPAAGVLFTHTHGDHIGLYKKIPPGVNRYMGPLAKEIMGVLTQRLDPSADVKGGPLVEAMRTYTPGKWMELDPDISVLPLYVDRSALDAYIWYEQGFEDEPGQWHYEIPSAYGLATIPGMRW